MEEEEKKKEEGRGVSLLKLTVENATKKALQKYLKDDILVASQ